MFKQKYQSYTQDPDNREKCYIVNTCKQNNENVYKEKPYLSQIESPLVRNIITRYRLDVNNCRDSKHRSFRCKGVKDNVCKTCNESQTVEHLILWKSPILATSHFKMFRDQYLNFYFIDFDNL